MYHNSCRDGIPSSLDRPFIRERLSSTTSCSSMSSRSGGAAGGGRGNNRSSALGSAPQYRRSQQHRPASPPYQHRNSNLSLSSSGSQQGSPVPSSARSIPTSGIGSDRYSNTSREWDSSERRSLNSSPNDIHKTRQQITHPRHHSNSNNIKRYGCLM